MRPTTMQFVIGSFEEAQMDRRRLLFPSLIAALLELGAAPASAGNCIWKLDGFELNADLRAKRGASQ